MLETQEIMSLLRFGVFHLGRGRGQFYLVLFIFLTLFFTHSDLLFYFPIHMYRNIHSLYI